MKIFVTTGNAWKLLTIILKSSILDVTGVQLLLVFFSKVVLIYNVHISSTLNIEKVEYFHF